MCLINVVWFRQNWHMCLLFPMYAPYRLCLTHQTTLEDLRHSRAHCLALLFFFARYWERSIWEAVGFALEACSHHPTVQQSRTMWWLAPSRAQSTTYARSHTYTLLDTFCTHHRVKCTCNGCSTVRNIVSTVVKWAHSTPVTSRVIDARENRR